MARTLVFLALLLTTACEDDAGTPCEEDYHCYSNSCTFGTCDSSLGLLIGEALDGDDWDDSSEEESYASPASEPPRACALLCEVLSEHACEQTAGCHVLHECGLPEHCRGAEFAFECLTLTCAKSTPVGECDAPCERAPRCVGRRACSYP